MLTCHNLTIKKWLGLGLTCLSNKFTHILKIKTHFFSHDFGFFFFGNCSLSIGPLFSKLKGVLLEENTRSHVFGFVFY